MKTLRRQLVVFAFLLLILVTTACSTPTHAPDLGGLYNKLAQNEDPYRNPVILIPGILGSKLVDESSGAIVWGTFGFGNAKQHKALHMLLPDEKSPEKRTQIAFDYLTKVLDRAKLFTVKI
jgi:hypothetical protein